MQSAANQLALFPDTVEPDPASGFSIRESGRAKRLSIKVFPRGRVEVVVPKRTRPQEVREFVEAHRDWIRNAREQFAAEHTPEPFVLPRMIKLAAIERQFLVEYRRVPDAKTVNFRRQATRVVLSGRIDDEQMCVRALKRWLTAIAREEYEPRLRTLSTVTGIAFRKLHVRGQRTCWGSHSSSGTISLNYCLLFLQPAHLRYVMIHELCHGTHMNHSRRFWQLVGRFEPGYKRIDKDLNSCWKHIPTWVGVY